MTIVVRPAITSARAPADLVLLGRVDRGGGVVEDEHPRVGQDGPGDGQALTLAPREREAPLADDGVVALGQLTDELVGAGQAGRSLDLALVGVPVGEGDVGGHGVVEEEGLLEHDADGPPQLDQLDVPHVDPVEAHPAAVDVIEPGQELGHGRLPRTGRPDEGHRLARRRHVQLEARRAPAWPPRRSRRHGLEADLATGMVTVPGREVTASRRSAMSGSVTRISCTRCAEAADRWARAMINPSIRSGQISSTT